MNRVIVHYPIGEREASDLYDVQRVWCKTHIKSKNQWDIGEYIPLRTGRPPSIEFLFSNLNDALKFKLIWG